MIASRVFFGVVLMTCCALTCAVSLQRQQHYSEASKHFIQYVTTEARAIQGARAKPVLVSQTVIISGEEVEFAVDGFTSAVIDYGKGLMTFVPSPEAETCYVTKFDREILTLEKINELLKKDQFEMPRGDQRQQMYLRRSRDQSLLNNMSEMSKSLCGKRTMIAMEKDSSHNHSHTALARRKREVGFWEVVLIVVVVIICFFLG